MSRRSRRQANQGNAKHSTGPKTEEGKAASSQNSFRHGLSAAAVIALPGENIQDYIDLGNALRAEHKPLTITEDILVGKMAQSVWLGRRAVNLQHQLSLAALSPDPKLLSLYIRYQSLHDRAFSRSLAELQSLRKEARQRQNGFVSQGRQQEIHQAKIHHLNTRTAVQQFNLHLRKTRSATAPAPFTGQQSPAAGSA